MVLSAHLQHAPNLLKSLHCLKHIMLWLFPYAGVASYCMQCMANMLLIEEEGGSMEQVCVSRAGEKE